MTKLVDTNILIYHLNGQSVASEYIIKNYSDIAISIITRIEVLSYSSFDEEQEVKVRHLLDAVQMVRLSDAIAEMTAQLRRQYRIKTPDAIIAASALSEDAELVTRNTKDFLSIEGLIVLNPFEETA